MPPVTISKVAVLLATYNGEKFLDEQLASIHTQTYPEIDILVSDDGSTDATKSILRQWRQRWTKGKISIKDGPRQGFSENFRSLLVRTPGSYTAYCFADQDDIWLPHKIERALSMLDAAAPGPALYGSRTRLVDERGTPIGLSPLFTRPKSFENALVQSMAGGNTMMLNPQAFALLAESSHRASFVTHDWWAYMLVTGAGGTAIYDPEPSLLYRQHAANIVGKNSGVIATFRRLGGVMSGQFRDWASANIAALETCEDMLSPQALSTLMRWKQVHEARPPVGLRALRQAGVYRQNVRGNIMLYLAALMGWL
ncbi:glycosyltransferase family 2 protein [Devosia marina]|nr:glycosyltransferase family 2 protein [Devosia marina]